MAKIRRDIAREEVSLTPAMKAMIEKVKFALIATIGRDGWPNVSPKGSIRIFDDHHLMFNEGTGQKTFQNLQNNPHIAISVVDRETHDGYQFKGVAEIITEGPVYEEAAAYRRRAGKYDTPLAAAVKVKILDIYSYRPVSEGGGRVV